ncbi:MAG: manganese efflux pump [Acidobacteriia bacterium]|nr:manganese efflux pump [Terriglobia bacterium]MBV8904639.1 manganese efflux pump [Terriglobia bacterium]
MVGTVILFGLLAGVDNLQACSALGLLPIDGGRRRLLAVAFTACETVAPLAGLALGHLMLSWMRDVGAKIGPFVTLACGIGILFCALRDEVPLPVNERRLIFGMPLALSFDNFLAGAGLSSLHYPVAISALIIGFVGACMSCAGLYLGAGIKRFIPSWMEFAAGIYLCFLGGRALSTGGA